MRVKWKATPPVLACISSPVSLLQSRLSALSLKSLVSLRLAVPDGPLDELLVRLRALGHRAGAPVAPRLSLLVVDAPGVLPARELDATNTLHPALPGSTSYAMDFSRPPGIAFREVRLLRFRVADRILFVGERGALAFASRTASSPHLASARRTFAPVVRWSCLNAACSSLIPVISAMRPWPRNKRRRRRGSRNSCAYFFLLRFLIGSLRVRHI